MYTVVISNEYRVFQKFVPTESCTLFNTFYVSLGKIQLGQQRRIQVFFTRGCTRLLLYVNTNKPHSFFFFFCRMPVVLENCRSSQRGEGGAHPLHPPARSAPGQFIINLSKLIVVSTFTLKFQ